MIEGRYHTGRAEVVQGIAPESLIVMVDARRLGLEDTAVETVLIYLPRLVVEGLDDLAFDGRSAHYELLAFEGDRPH